jgi:hypothetical protein
MLNRFSKSKLNSRIMMLFLLSTINSKNDPKLRVEDLTPLDNRKDILSLLAIIISNLNKTTCLLTWLETIRGPKLNPRLSRTGCSNNLVFNKMSIKGRKWERWFLALRLLYKVASFRCTSTKRRTFRITTGISKLLIISPEMKISD